MNFIIMWHWVGSPGGGIVASLDDELAADALCAILREHGSELKVFSVESVKDLF